MDEPFILCDSPPRLILVRHNRISALPFTSLATDVTPVFPIESRSEIDGVLFTRTQIPLTPAFAITNYKSEGETIPSGILDLKISSTKTDTSRPKINHKHYTSLNVQLGRITSLAGLWLREPIQLSDVQYKPDPALQVEVDRLAALDQSTIKVWSS